MHTKRTLHWDFVNQSSGLFWARASHSQSWLQTHFALADDCRGLNKWPHWLWIFGLQLMGLSEKEGWPVTEGRGGGLNEIGPHSSYIWMLCHQLVYCLERLVQYVWPCLRCFAARDGLWGFKSSCQAKGTPIPWPRLLPKDQDIKLSYFFSTMPACCALLLT